MVAMHSSLDRVVLQNWRLSCLIYVQWVAMQRVVRHGLQHDHIYDHTSLVLLGANELLVDNGSVTPKLLVMCRYIGTPKGGSGSRLALTLSVTTLSFLDGCPGNPRCLASTRICCSRVSIRCGCTVKRLRASTSTQGYDRYFSGRFFRDRQVVGSTEQKSCRNDPSENVMLDFTTTLPYRCRESDP